MDVFELESPTEVERHADVGFDIGTRRAEFLRRRNIDGTNHSVILVDGVGEERAIFANQRDVLATEGEDGSSQNHCRRGGNGEIAFLEHRRYDETCIKCGKDKILFNFTERGRRLAYYKYV